MSWFSKWFLPPVKHEAVAIPVTYLPPAKARYHLDKLIKKLGEYEALPESNNPSHRVAKKALLRSINSRRDLLMEMGFQVPINLAAAKKLRETVT